MFDMMKMMGKMKEVQEKMKAAQDSLSEIKAEAESGGGMVKATVNGKKEVINLEIDPSIVNKEDAEIMRDLVIAAINLAIESVEVKSKEHLKKATEGVIPNIPGMDLNNFM